MPLAWLVECKTCLQRFPAKKREPVPGKSTDAIERGKDAGQFECPHCHEIHSYRTDDLIPGEGRIYTR